MEPMLTIVCFWPVWTYIPNLSSNTSYCSLVNNHSGATRKLHQYRKTCFSNFQYWPNKKHPWVHTLLAQPVHLVRNWNKHRTENLESGEVSSLLPLLGVLACWETSSWFTLHGRPKTGMLIHWQVSAAFCCSGRSFTCSSASYISADRL